MKKLEKILEEVTEISQIPMILYDLDGNFLFQSFKYFCKYA